MFVLAFANIAGSDDDGADADSVVSDPDGELDGWGTPEDLQAVREHIRLVPERWDPWEGRPAEVPVVEKATGALRWEIPASLGEPVAPNLRPVGAGPGGAAEEKH